LATKNIQTLKEILSELESVNRKMGLKINEEKTKCMILFPTQAQKQLLCIIICYFKFQGVVGFIYLGSVLNT
jgi:hypothetical protein